MTRKAARRRQVSRQFSNRPIFAAFLLSGLAGLMHEVVWAKLLVQLTGATAYAQAVVLGVFMGGLAVGSFLFGRKADRRGGALRTYVVLELAIGSYCLLLPLLLQVAKLGYVSLAERFFGSAGLQALIRLALVTLLVLLPAVLMGGTLPILARRIVSRVEDTQRLVARLYSLNSLGAVLGAGLAGFVLLPALGVYPSLAAASVLNFVAAGLVFRQAQREGGEVPSIGAGQAAKPSGQKQGTALPAYGGEQYVVTLVALAASGFAAMGYEVVFTRIIALSFGSSTYSFTVMLMSFITGIALGSALISRLEVRRPLWLLGVSQVTVVVALLLATPLVSRLPYLVALLRIELQETAWGFELYQLGKAALCLAVLLVPTTCLGFSFPLVARVQARHPEEIGARVGSTYAWNAVGNVLGVVGTSLGLLPWLGMVGALHLNLALSLTAGLALLVVAGETPIRRRLVAAGAGSVAVLVYLAAGTGWSDPVTYGRNHLRLRSGPDSSLEPSDHARHPASSFSAWEEAFVVHEGDPQFRFFEEDAHATVLAAGIEENIQLYVNTKPDASTGADLDSQLLVAHAPLFLNPDARTLLVIGHGSGISAGSALLHPIERADIVEISSAVLHAYPVFAKSNYRVLEDPRVDVHVDDAQSFLLTVPRSYDVVISQPSNPWVAGIGGLFTVEYFERVRSKLNPGGVFSLWFHAYELSDEGTQLIVRTLASVFPNVMLFGDDDLGNLIALAAMDPLEPDFAAMERRYRNPAIRDDLARLRITNLAAFLSHHRVSQRRFAALVRPGPLNTAAHERLEYIGPRAFFSNESSYFLARFDPLVQGNLGETGLLLDGYIAYRATGTNPIDREELEAAARYARNMGGYGPRVAWSIAARARRLAPQLAPGTNATAAAGSPSRPRSLR